MRCPGNSRSAQPKDIAVTFDRELRAIQVEPSAKGEPRVTRINFDARSGRFDATLEIPTGAGKRGTLRLSGRAAATVEVVTLLRPLERGALIKSADVTVERRPRAEIGRDIVSGSEQAIGLAARTALQAGRPLRVSRPDEAGAGPAQRDRDAGLRSARHRC